MLALADTVMSSLSILSIVNIEENAVNCSKLKWGTCQESVGLIFSHESFS
uniref:Uncharacterized protein n=1 Tax=Arundo donax TaxID=35708 RepID=A0A0A9E997_ARUDO